MAKVMTVGRNTVNTYTYLKSAAELNLKIAEKTEDGQLYYCMSSLMFSAFTLEAYLNHIGSELLPSWQDVDRTSPRNKLNAVCSLLQFPPDFSKEPYQSFVRIFKLRNTLAHGRTENIKGVWKKRIPQINGAIPPESFWQKECVPDVARRIYDAMLKIIREIHVKAGKKGDPFAIMSHGIAVEPVGPN
ncbi:MAG: hypothetical protein PHF56_11530 [Desulfuromonadaceae bacterium]|nr:hypothetical protein [Desulfuromonadaceae bacterium]